MKNLILAVSLLTSVNSFALSFAGTATAIVVAPTRTAAVIFIGSTAYSAASSAATSAGSEANKKAIAQQLLNDSQNYHAGKGMSELLEKGVSDVLASNSEASVSEAVDVLTDVSQEILRSPEADQ